jgi:hypothetical protein
VTATRMATKANGALWGLIWGLPTIFKPTFLLISNSYSFLLADVVSAIKAINHCYYCYLFRRHVLPKDLHTSGLPRASWGHAKAPAWRGRGCIT